MNCWGDSENPRGFTVEVPALDFVGNQASAWMMQGDSLPVAEYRGWGPKKKTYIFGNENSEMIRQRLFEMRRTDKSMKDAVALNARQEWPLQS